MKTTLWIIVGCTFIAAVTISVWEFYFDLSSTMGVDGKSLRLELFKVVWQFLLIAVLGGAIGLYFKAQETRATTQRQDEERARERRKANRESLLRTRADLVKAYNQAKSIRRLLRALAFEEVSQQTVVRRDNYIASMQELIKVQLEFEFYADAIQSESSRFEKPKELIGNLKSIGDYLKDIVTEFEEAWMKFRGAAHAPAAAFPRLDEFLRALPEEEDAGRFNIKFRKPFKEVLKLVELAVLNVTG